MDEEQKEEETLSIGLFSCFREFYTIIPHDFGFKKMRMLSLSISFI